MEDESGTQRTLVIPSRWCELDPRIPALMPRSRRIARTTERAVLEHRLVTRSLEVVAVTREPLDELARLVAVLEGQRCEVVIRDAGVIAKGEQLRLYATCDARHGTYELHVELEREHDDVDLRAELEDDATLAPAAAIAELGRFVTRVDRVCAVGREPTLAFTVVLDDETRHGVLAWATAHELVQAGNTWSKLVATRELAIMFERADELGVDEATVFLRAPRRRSLARGSCAEFETFEEVAPTQIVDDGELPLDEPRGDTATGKFPMPRR